MIKQTDYEWDLILDAAEKLGVGRYARMKWRNRNMVPHRWRVDIIRLTNGVVGWHHFRDMDAQSRNAA